MARKDLSLTSLFLIFLVLFNIIFFVVSSEKRDENSPSDVQSTDIAGNFAILEKISKTFPEANFSSQEDTYFYWFTKDSFSKLKGKMIKADDVQSDLNLEEFFKEEDFKSQNHNTSNGDLAIRSSYYDDEVVCVLERILPDDSDDKMDVIVSCAYDSIDSVVDSVVDSSNEILAIYELEDRVVFSIENPSKAVFSDWTKAGMKSWSRLPYSTSFDSGWKGVKIKKGMGYQIEIKGSAGIIYSDIYYFQGNRAVIEDLRCPYESYVKNECDF